MSTLHTISIAVYPKPGQPASNQVSGIAWFPGITVVQAMLIADATDTADFRFRAVYASLYGAFIDAINDLADAGDKYWMLYVNGVPSSLGVSESILIEDSSIQSIDIEWRYETVGKDHPLKDHLDRKLRAASR